MMRWTRYGAALCATCAVVAASSAAYGQTKDTAPSGSPEQGPVWRLSPDAGDLEDDDFDDDEDLDDDRLKDEERADVGAGDSAAVAVAATSDDAASDGGGDGSFWIGAYGFAYGVAIAILVDDEGGPSTTVAWIVPPALTIAGVVTANQLELTSAQGGLISAGGNWSGVNGALLALALGRDDAMLRSGVVAAGLGIGAASYIAYHRPELVTTGDVSLINSGGLFGLTVTALGIGNARLGSTSDTYTARTLLVGTQVGLLAGALFGAHNEVPRGGVWLMDLGGALGMGLGYYAVAERVAGGCDSDGLRRSRCAAAFTATTGASLAGALAGMGLMWLALDAFDMVNPEPGTERVSGMPKLRPPTLFVRPHEARDGAVGVSAGLDVLHGTF